MTKYSNLFIEVVKNYLSKANIILLLILVFILYQLHSLNQLSNIRSDPTQTQIEVRIVSDSRKNFETVYYVEYNFKIWRLKSKEKFKLGFSYFVTAIVTINLYIFDNTESNFEDIKIDSKNNNTSLSNGVYGQIEIIKIIKEIGCDYLCITFEKVKTLKSYASTEILKLSCNYYGLDWEHISPFSNCTDISALMQGLLLGGSQGFSKQMQTNFKITGVTHIVAISGFNITLIIVLVESILKRFEISFSFQFWLILGFLTLFIILVGTSASVLRAGFMGFFMLLAKLVKRPCSGIRALFLSTIVILLYNPFYVYSISFQLSFLATFGLLSFLNFDDLFTQKWIPSIFENAWSTIVANLYTLPVLINTFGYFSPLSILPNMIILPMVPIVMLLDLFTIIPIIGKFIGFIAALGCAWILGLIEWFSQWLPLIYMEKMNWLEILFWYVFLLSITKFVKFYHRFKLNQYPVKI